jgi:hypothetical protein
MGNEGTTDFEKEGKYYYYIYQTTVQNPELQIQENGTFSPVDPRNVLQRASVTSAAPSNFGARSDRIINVYADTILHDFRQVKVWDEQVRRTAVNDYLLCSAYQNWNPSFFPEVVDGQNERVPQGDLFFDYTNGLMRVDSDDGAETYYVTYVFDLFPPQDLKNFLDLTLQELNVAGADVGGHITTYKDVDSTPQYWDAPLTFGVVSKAFRRIATDSVFWKNFLIWVEGNNGASLARESSEYYQNLFLEISKSIKKVHYIAAPSPAFSVFESLGFGQLGINSSRFRELRINRVSTF